MMNCIARALAVSGVVPLLAGCADGSRRQHGESAMGKELIGTWDITFHLERSPGLVTDTLSVKRDVRGSLALLANRSENRYPGVGEPSTMERTTSTSQALALTCGMPAKYPQLPLTRQQRTRSK